MPLREQADAGVPLVLTDPDDPAAQAIRQAARGLVALLRRRCELPVLAGDRRGRPGGSACRWRAPDAGRAAYDASRGHA